MRVVLASIYRLLGGDEMEWGGVGWELLDVGMYISEDGIL